MRNLISLNTAKQSLAALATGALLFLLSAAQTMAQDGPGSEAARGFVADLNRVILFPLIALLSGIAFLLFIVGCAEYIMGANNPQAREKGVKHITYGVIGLVIMLSAWTILGLVAGTFGLEIPT